MVGQSMAFDLETNSFALPTIALISVIRNEIHASIRTSTIQSDQGQPQ
jgi:hypothetical protein